MNRLTLVLLVLLLGSLVTACSTTSRQIRVSASFARVFLTWGLEDTARTMTVNLFVGGEIDEAVVEFDTEARASGAASYRFRVPAQSLRLPHLSGLTLLRAHLVDLEPRQSYRFRFATSTQYLTPEHRFRTLPSGDAPIRMIVGGDHSIHEAFAPMCRVANTFSPDLAVFGGDLAYANGKPVYWGRWLKWLKILEQTMVDGDGHLVPILAAIGNHEVNDSSRSKPRERSPFFVPLFQPEEKRTYYRRRLGSHSTLVLLDSNHIARPKEQVEWLDANLAPPSSPHNLLAVYHVPLYPSSRDFDNSASKKVRQAWGPIFDKHGLDLGLEHHEHSMKRTKPLKGEQVVSEGTVYIGDGGWGRRLREVDDERPYLAKAATRYHFWVIDLAADGISGRAIGQHGDILDEFSLVAD